MSGIGMREQGGGGPSAMQHIGCDHACSEQARTTPQTSPLALVGPQSDCDQRISSFRVSTFQIYHAQIPRYRDSGFRDSRTQDCSAL